MWTDTWDADTDAAVDRLVGPIVVLGAGGFIGANLVRSLLNRRSDVYAVARRRGTWRLLDLPEENVRLCNLLSQDDTAQLLDTLRPQTIFNLSAHGGYSHQDDARLIHATNYTATEQLLRLLRQQRFHAYVHAGSSSEYGKNASAPVEGSPLEPNSDYSVSKIAASYLIRYYGKQLALPCINLRLYSVYGAFEDPGRLVPALIREGLAGRYPRLVDPNVSRDFVYIDDATAAFVLAATQGVHSAIGESLNIGSGVCTTIADIVDVAREVLNIPAAPEFKSMSNRRWDLGGWYGNPARAQEVLGWKANTDLRTGLAKTRDWFAARPNYAVELSARRERISAVIACYRDAQAIPLMYERLTQVFSELNVDYEIIFVNDCSPDNSAEVLAALTQQDSHVVAIEHTRNFGSQAAFTSGMEVASGDAVVLLDGDLQDPPELIAQLHAKWKQGYDVVFGVREKRVATWFMQRAAKLFYRVFRSMAYVDMPLDSGDFSLMSRQVVDQLVALPERDQFLRGLRAWVGFRQTGVRYVRPERAFGVSTNNLRKNIWWAKKGIFSFSYTPLELMGYVGLGVTAASLLGAVYAVIAKFLDPGIPRGFSALTVIVLFLSGVQLLSLSVIGEYIGKIFEEVKQRPRFIRRSVRVGKTIMTQESEVSAFVQERQKALAP